MVASTSDVLDGSKVVRRARRAIAESTAAERVRNGVRRATAVPEAAGTWVRNAAITSKLAGFGRAAEESELARASREGTEWANGSFLYRWLTAEPEPDVVVIDLRETLSIGPIVDLLDRVLRWIVPYWTQSIPGRVLGVLVDWGERFAETRFGQLLVAVLEPPEPPERIEGRSESERLESQFDSEQFERSSDSDQDGRERQDDDTK